MPKFEGVQQQILLEQNKNQLVSAGAGSGKTTVMIEKLSNMIINEGVNVENLLVVTFTVLAAAEMKERLAELCGAEAAKKVTLGTFHAFAGRLLRREIG